MTQTLKKRFKALAVFMSVFVFAACSDGRGAQTKDLATGNDSNVASPYPAQTLSLDQVELLRVLPNTKIPKGVFVHLIDQAGWSNRDFVKNLYSEIRRINETEGLIATIGNSNPTTNDLYFQQITLVVLVDAGKAGEYRSFVSEMGGQDGTLPYAIMLETDSINSDPWIQDFGEFAALKVSGTDEPFYTVVDTFRNNNRRMYDPAIFKNAFNISLVYAGDNTLNSAQFGGNIEATPEGILYMGDSVDDGHYDHTSGRASSIFETLAALGNPDAMKISSDWLAVGHIDEYLTYMPSAYGCGSVLFYGNPLQALKILIEEASANDFAVFANEFENLPINDSFDSLDVKLTKESLNDALAHFSRSGGQGGISLNIADYGLGRAESAWVQMIETRRLDSATFQQLRSDVAQMSRLYIWLNLRAQMNIEASVAALQQGTSCDQVESLPQTFLPNFNVWSDSVYYLKDTAHLPGMTNALVLRDYAIIPDPGVSSLREIVRQTVGAHLGGMNKVSFLEDGFYHHNWGEIHCGTNVIREFNLDMQIN
jgi:protein-arginine deiminase